MVASMSSSPGTHAQAARELCLSGGGKRPAFLMPDAHRLNFATPDGIAESVQRVSDQTEDVCYANLLQRLDQDACYRLRH